MLGISIFILYRTNWIFIMSKKLSLKEQLQNPKLREGILDGLLNRIKKGKIKAKEKEIIQLLTSRYGSWDKVPDWRKKHYGLS